MNITIIGTGYVGLVTGACLADLGNNVFCLDVDQAKIDLLNHGGVPIYEPGLKEIIERNVDAGRLTFSTDLAASVAHASVQFIAVGTPPDEDGSADLQYVLAAARNIGRHMTDFKVVVDKSTVPVGTADKVAAAINEELVIASEARQSMTPEPVIASEARQSMQSGTLDCHVANAPRNDGANAVIASPSTGSGQAEARQSMQSGTLDCHVANAPRNDGANAVIASEARQSMSPEPVIASEARQSMSPGFSVVSNPEFLKEGAAVEDFTRPDRIVLGVANDAAGERALNTMRQLYAPFNRNHERTRVMDVKSAEFTKYAANAMLATRISFMNELANLADQVGADIELVRQGIGSDPRIGYSFLYAGTGYGGSCFPKDVQALARTAREHGQTLRVLEAVETVNHDQKQVLVNKIFAKYGPKLAGKTFALWGLAFKPNTDDMRDAPSRVIISALLRAGASINAHDPVAQEEAKRVLAQDLADAPKLLQNLQFADKAMETVQGADALIIVTEWKAYRSPNWTALRAAMKEPVVFDGRNLYEPQEMKENGMAYVAIGRGNHG
jgi:UDPglucose 6-dehydrogenase